MLSRKNNNGFIGLLVLLIATAIIAIISYRAMIQTGDNPIGAGEAKKQIDKAKEIADLAKERVEQIEGRMEDAEEILKKNKIDATLKITVGEDKRDYFRTIENGASVMDIMKKIDEDEEDFSFEYKDSSMGAFIEKINGIGNDAKKNMYWMFYVNGKLSQAGASDYKAADGDVIEWKYEDSSNAF